MAPLDELRDLSIDRAEVLNHISGLAASTLCLAVLRTGFMTTFNALRVKHLFLFGGEFGSLVLRKVMILNCLGLTFAGHQLRYADSCVCSILSCLTNEILINGHTRIKVIPQTFV